MAGAAFADIIVVSTPMNAITSIPAAPLRGKIVIDTNNYYAVHPLTGITRDGRMPELDDESTTTSELLQKQLPGARVVKAVQLHHGQAPHLRRPPQRRPRSSGVHRRGQRPSRSPNRRRPHRLLRLRPRRHRPLAEGWRIQRDTPGYVKPYGVTQLKEALASAKRYRDM